MAEESQNTQTKLQIFFENIKCKVFDLMAELCKDKKQGI